MPLENEDKKVVQQNVSPHNRKTESKWIRRLEEALLSGQMENFEDL